MKRLSVFCFLILSLFLLLPTAARAGSKFYLTIDRSFAPNEKPKIRLDFLDLKEPLQLRVLKPKNIDGFLEGQLNLSRAYEEPRSQINAGHYFTKGVNKISSPLFELRSLLSPNFRNGFGGDQFNHPLALRSSKELAGVPDEVTQGPPPNFEVVRQLFIDLQRGGEIPEGLYDWDDSYWSEKYNIRQIELEPLPDGVYLVQAVQGKEEGQALLQVSSLGVQVKQSSNQLLFRVIDRTLAPVVGAEIAIRDSRGSWRVLPQKTNVDGDCLYESSEGPLDGRLVSKILAPGERFALVETDFLPATNQDNSVFVLTDRPIFKPGETFYFKGMLRHTEAGALKIPLPLPAETQVVLESSDSSYRSAAMVLPLTPFGTFSGAVALSPVQPPGLYRLVAQINSSPYAGELRVRDYIKPTFYLELLERDPTITPGQEFHLKVRARRYAGGVPRDGRYEVFIYRKRFEAPQFVADAGGDLAACSDYVGEVRSAASLAQPQRLYSSVEARAQTDGTSSSGNSWESAPGFNQDGEANITVTVPEVKTGPAAVDSNVEWTYSIVVRAMDSTGAFSNLSENIYRTRSEVVAAVATVETVVDPTAKDVSFVVRASYPDGKAAPRVSGELTVQLLAPSAALSVPSTLASQQFVTAEDGLAKLVLTKPSQPGKIVARATLLKIDNRELTPPAISAEAVAVLPGSKHEAVTNGEALQLFTNGTLLSPGERRAVFVALPKNWGSNEQGRIWQTVAGEKIFSHDTATVNGRGVWLDVEAKPEFGSGFYYTVGVPVQPGKLVEETVGFRIVPKDKRLSIAIQPEPGDAEPLRPYKLAFQVNDSAGNPASDVELAVSVVDRAVYAVQPEFRPEISEFFYPLPRLNVATFNSDELQGYGYADEIKHPNFSLTALKSSIKPQKRAMRDTAGWFPHVVTDAQGRAQVTLDMPANITEWLVTAVALDANGRMGEGIGRFNSSADIVVEPRTPQFLREGDLVQGNLVVENKTDSAQQLGVEVLATGGLQLANSDVSPQLVLPANKEALLPFTLTGASITDQGSTGVTIGTLELRTTATTATNNLRVGGPQQFDIKIAPNSLRLPFQGFFNPQDGVISFPELAQEIVPRDVRIFVSKGVTGAVLALSSRLVSYPWGCTEQLVHTTIPNLILLDALQKGGVNEETLARLPDSLGLRDARAYAELGVQKLLRNQKSNGAFGLWSGDSNGSLPLSLMAASALKLAKEAGVKSAGLPLQNVRTYISSVSWENDGQAFDVESRPYRGMLLAYAAESESWGSLREKLAGYVQEILADKAARLDEIVFASRIMRGVKDAWWISEEFGDGNDSIIPKLTERLKSSLRKPNVSAMVFPVSALMDDVGFQYGNQSILAAALGELEELNSAGEPAHEFDPLIRSLLLKTRYVNFSTLDSASLVFALRGRIVREQKTANAATNIAADDSTAVPLLNSQPLTPVPGGYYLDPKDSPKNSQKNSSEKPVKSGSRLEQVPADAMVIITASADVPYNKIRSLSHGLAVSRTLFRIEAAGAVPLLPGSALKVGDTIISRVDVSRMGAERGYSPASRFVVVEDAIPSLTEVLDDDRTALADAKLIKESVDTWWSKVKQTLRYPDRTERVIEIRPGGTGSFYQVYQVRYRGDAALPPARAYDMYSTDIAGVSDAGALKVE